MLFFKQFLFLLCRLSACFYSPYSVHFVDGFIFTSVCLNGLGSCFIFLTLSSDLLVVSSLSGNTVFLSLF